VHYFVIAVAEILKHATIMEKILLNLLFSSVIVNTHLTIRLVLEIIYPYLISVKGCLITHLMHLHYLPMYRTNKTKECSLTRQSVHFQLAVPQLE